MSDSSHLCPRWLEAREQTAAVGSDLESGPQAHALWSPGWRETGTGQGGGCDKNRSCLWVSPLSLEAWECRPRKRSLGLFLGDHMAEL